MCVAAAANQWRPLSINFRVASVACDGGKGLLDGGRPRNFSAVPAASPQGRRANRISSRLQLKERKMPSQKMSADVLHGRTWCADRSEARHTALRQRYA